jgi:hypothetical protein
MVDEIWYLRLVWPVLLFQKVLSNLNNDTPSLKQCFDQSLYYSSSISLALGPCHIILGFCYSSLLFKGLFYSTYSTVHSCSLYSILFFACYAAHMHRILVTNNTLHNSDACACILTLCLRCIFF